MILANLRIRNFRGIAAMDLPLDRHITVIHGDNGAGKTSVLDAVAAALSRVLTRLPQKGTMYLLGRGDVRRAANVTLAHLSISVSTTSGTTLSRQPGFSGVANRRTLAELTEALAAVALGAPDVAVPLFAYYGTHRAVLTLPERERNFRKEFERLGALDHALSAMTRFKTVFEWLGAKEAEENAEKVQRRDFNYSDPQLAAVRAAIEAAIPRISRLRVGHRPIRLMATYTAPGGQPQDFEFSQLAGGYQTAVALVADLARRMVQGNPHLGTQSEAIVLIDEVDLHLHPRWQAEVMPSLRRAFPNAQFIVTTHSEQVITSVQPEQVVKLSTGANGVTWSHPNSTYGAEANRVLQDQMDVPNRQTAVQQVLDQYIALIQNGEYNSDPALECRRQLDEWFRGEDPAMVRADLEIRRHQLLASRAR